MGRSVTDFWRSDWTMLESSGSLNPASTTRRQTDSVNTREDSLSSRTVVNTSRKKTGSSSLLLPTREWMKLSHPWPLVTIWIRRQLNRSHRRFFGHLASLWGCHGPPPSPLWTLEGRWCSEMVL